VWGNLSYVLAVPFLMGITIVPFLMGITMAVTYNILTWGNDFIFSGSLWNLHRCRKYFKEVVHFFLRAQTRGLRRTLGGDPLMHLFFLMIEHSIIK
jgi:hypothetical protein